MDEVDKQRYDEFNAQANLGNVLPCLGWVDSQEDSYDRELRKYYRKLQKDKTKEDKTK